MDVDIKLQLSAVYDVFKARFYRFLPGVTEIFLRIFNYIEDFQQFFFQNSHTSSL